MAVKRPTYDAAREPKNWLKLDEDKRLELVLEYHQKLSTPHPKTRVPRVHAAVHVIVETQLATGDPRRPARKNHSTPLATASSSTGSR